MQRLEHSLEPEPIKRQCHDQQKDENDHTMPKS